MAVSIQSLLSPLVKKDVLADLYTLTGLALGYPLALQDGEPVPAVLDVVVGWICDKFWNPLALPALRAVFLDYSAGDWLSFVAWLIYNRPRILAQSATGPIVVENHAAIFSGTIAVGQVRIRSTVTGKTYTNTTSGAVTAYVSGPFPVPPAALLSYQVLLNFEADEVGTPSNAQPGDISTTPVSAPSGIFVQTNASALLGSDVESDSNLILRARAAAASRSVGGPRKAYLDAALDPIGAFVSRNLTPPTIWGTAAPAILRVRIQEPAGSAPWTPSRAYALSDTVTNVEKLYIVTTAGTSAGSGGPTGTANAIVDGSVTWMYVGTVAVWLASASGPSGGTSSDVTSDVGKANVAIQMFCVPPGVTATVAAAVALSLDLGTITINVTAESLVTAEEARATATAALDAFFSTLPIGGARAIANGQGWVYANKVVGVIEQGAGVITANISLLVADVAVNVNQVVVPSHAVPIQVNIVSQGT